jgi:beta-galactosidase
VAKKQLALEITVNNPGPKAVTVSVANEIVPWNKGEGGPPAKTFASRDISITAKAAETVTVAEPWADPRLWWPDDPHLYCVVTKVSVNGRVVDVKRTRFGFREWTWDSLAFRLNGVPWQMWAECDYGPSPEAWLEKTRTSGMNMMRYWRRDGWGGKTRRQVLDLMDERGMPVRNSGVFDGEHAAYGLVETVDGRKQPRWDLFDNWTEQMRAWIRAERNHPSVFIWSIENEIVYINANNFGNGEVVEPAIRDAAREVMKWDPTRPVMVDGGRALRDGSLPVNGCHYNDESGCDLRDYPDAAYDLEHWYDTLNRNAWPMVRNRPMLHGECFYANGWTPAKFATIGGERCFIGMAETAEATGWYARMLSEGWRWAGVSAWHFWFGEADRAYYQAWQPVAAFCRQWNWTFAGGSNVPRTLKVFNGTRHADPITLAWTLTVGGKEAARGGESLQIPPGEAQQVEITLAVPKVADRTAGEFVLTCSRGGKEVYRDAKAVAVIDPAAGPKPAAGKADLVVLDPKGPVKARLAARGIAFTEVATVDAIPEGVNVLVVGPDAVPADRSADPMWLRLAAAGAKILVLDQAHPLHYQALPADLEPTEFAGRIAFSEDLTHPAFAGLEQKDFFTWSGDHVVYRAAYKKGSRGARSLLQCDFQLDYTALAECPVNDGVLVLCQAAVGTKLAADPVAQRMFDNLLAAAAAYAPVRKTVALAVPPDTPRGRLLRNIGLTYDDVSDPVEAVGGARGIAVVDATPANLKALAGATDKVRKFTDAGGWLMLWNVGPEGLADFNRIVGVEHLLRPFRPERVLLATPRDPLTSGLTLRDVVMEDPEKINAWMAVRWAADDAFTHVVDLTDIAPFAALPTPEEMGKGPDRRDPRSDHWPPNMVNGFTAADTWRYCYSILLDDGHATKWTLALPREESITNFSIVLNTIYHRVTKINLYFDDDPKPFVILTRPDESRQDFAVDGRKAKRLTIELAEWEKSGRSNVIGIDNLWIGVARSDDLLARVRPLLNIGGLVRYQMGAGGVVLCQLNIPPAERLPLNAEKKAAIAKVVLRNLGAAFQGGRTVVVGEDLACRPVAIPESAFNAYLTRKGKPAWFPGKGDLSHLPAGENRFAGVVFRVLDFATSPVPSCIMLKGHQSGVQAAEVAGIPVGRRAAALFFLHTYNPQRRTQEWQPADDRGRTRPPLELFRYVVHYADGQTADVPVFWRQGVAGWLDADPRPLIDAAVAWAAPFAGDDSGAKAVLYAMQWTNPRPDEPITHINVTLGPDGEKHGAPAVLAITAAEVRK